MIKLKGTTIYPPGIFEILHQAGIADYVVEVSTGSLDTDELKLMIAANDHSQAQVSSIFQSRFKVLPEISVMSVSEIEKIHMSEGQRKPRRFVDKRK